MTDLNIDIDDSEHTDVEREKLRRFVDGNRIAEEQSRLGLSKPLDLNALLARVEKRIAGSKMEQ